MEIVKKLGRRAKVIPYLYSSKKHNSPEEAKNGESPNPETLGESSARARYDRAAEPTPSGDYSKR